tara:strand:- start:226 stop:855 length:630 start_codon:yes stop_codon:yes gene_type:complete
MKIDVLTDNKESWIVEYIPELLEGLKDHEVRHVFNSSDAEGGDVLCALSCEKILKREVLDRYKSCVVAHPSPLPKGKGWSPVAWQVLEGNTEIPVSLIEAADKVDSGDIYYQEYFPLDGTELNAQIKAKQFEVTKRLVLKYIQNFPVQGQKQEGEETFYRKFTREDNRIDIQSSLEAEFNKLRVADNDRYPCWFEYKGKKFKLLVEDLD